MIISLLSFGHIIVIINHSIIDKKTCDSRALLSLSPIVTPEAPTQNDSEQTDHPSLKTGTTRKNQGPSEYLKRHEANIAMNKELLASLGLGKPEGVGILGESLSGGEKKDKVGLDFQFIFAIVILMSASDQVQVLLQLILLLQMVW